MPNELCLDVLCRLVLFTSLNSRWMNASIHFTKPKEKNWELNPWISHFEHDNKLIRWLNAGSTFVCVCARARALVACATQFSRFTFLVIINTNIIKLYFINNYKMWFHLIKLVVKGALIRSIFNLYTHCKHRERDANLSDILSHPLRLSACSTRVRFPPHSFDLLVFSIYFRKLKI